MKNKILLLCTLLCFFIAQSSEHVCHTLLTDLSAEDVVKLRNTHGIQIIREVGNTAQICGSMSAVNEFEAYLEHKHIVRKIDFDEE